MRTFDEIEVLGDYFSKMQTKKVKPNILDMKFIINNYTPNKDNPEIYSVSETDPFTEFDTDWFLETKPSLKETHLFVPEWADATDEDTVILFFLAECAKELIENNSHILSEEAINALLSFIEPDCPPTISKIEDEEDLPF